MNRRFSLRILLVATTFACVAVFLCVKFWPRPRVLGPPNLSGTLVDPKGNPVPSASVSVYDCPSTGFTWPTPRRKATTNDLGNFRFESVAFRPYAELFQFPSRGDGDQFLFQFRVEHKTLFLKSCYDRPDQFLDLIKDFDYEFELEMSLGGAVSGLLTSKSGVPISGTKVRFVSRGHPSFNRVFTTDQTGRFKTFALPPRPLRCGNFLSVMSKN